MITELAELGDEQLNQTVYVTRDYNKFSLKNENRKIKPKKVEQLVNAINQLDLTEDHPIIVDENFGIEDGQHRFTACMRLGLPIYYKIGGMALGGMAILNQNQDPWTAEDWIRYYAAQGSDSYTRLQNDTEKHKISASAVGQLTGLRIYKEEVMSGKIFYAEGDSKYLASVMAELKVFSKTHKFSSITIFKIAYGKLRSLDNFKFSQVKEQLEKCPFVLTKQRGILDYLDNLVEFYNYNRSAKNKIFIPKEGI